MAQTGIAQSVIAQHSNTPNIMGIGGGDKDKMTLKSSLITLFIILMLMIGIQIGNYLFQPKTDFGKVIYPQVEVKR